MSFVPRITCRRCGRQFSGLRSRCPYCGTRRVKASERTPVPTPGMNSETGAGRRNNMNARWQLIFGAILLAAVLLAVIVLVSVSLNGAVKATPTPTLPAVTAPPVATPEPTPTPTPTPSVSRIDITSWGTVVTDITVGSAGDASSLKGVVWPAELDPVPTVEWAVSDESVATVTVSADAANTVTVTAVGPGSTTLTATCGAVTSTCIIRVKG